MRSKIKVFISAAVAAALSIGVAASAESPSSDSAYYEDSPRSALAPQPTVTEADKERFEEMLLSGYKVGAAFTKLNGTVGIHGEPDGTDLIDLYAADSNSPSSLDTYLELDLVHDYGEGYQLWSGRYEVADVSMFSNLFTTPDHFDCSVGNNGTMTVKNVFAGNYKTVTVNQTYLENGKRVTKSKSGENSSKTTLTVTPDIYKGTGKLVEVSYFFYLHAGTVSSAPRYEVAVIHIVDSNYAQTEQYAELPYARLIDFYTYVDTAEIGVMPPMDDNV